MSRSRSRPLSLPRSLLLVPLGLVGCHDFVGELGRIGFVSDLRVAGEAWTPAHPIAAGSTAHFLPVALLGADGRELPASEGGAELELEGSISGRRLDSWSQPGWTQPGWTQPGWTQPGWTDEAPVLAVTSEGGRGTVHYRGEAQDRFGVEFVAARSAGVLDPEVVALGGRDAGALDARRLVVLEGGTAHLAVELRDRRGRSLGYNPEELDLTAGGGVSAWLEEGGALVLVADGPGTLALSLLGEPLATLQVETAGLDELVEIELLDVPLRAGLVESTDAPGGLVAVWARPLRLDGQPVLGVTLDWSEAGPLDAVGPVGERTDLVVVPVGVEVATPSLP